MSLALPNAHSGLGARRSESYSSSRFARVALRNARRPPRGPEPFDPVPAHLWTLAGSAVGTSTGGTDFSDRVLSADAAIELAHAMVAHHLGVTFAPIVCLTHGLGHGVEAQPRWRALDEVDPATRDLLHLARSTGPSGASSEALLDEAARAAERHRLAPSAFRIEVTETDVLADTMAAGTVLRDLHTLGCGVGIGDVGAGCAVLSQLHRMPVDFVRIQARHVAAMLDDIESQADWLRDLGCQLGQGAVTRSTPRLSLPAWRSSSACCTSPRS